jgi:hypothetical protein
MTKGSPYHLEEEEGLFLTAHKLFQTAAINISSTTTLCFLAKRKA